jgi:hypothetical protein
LQASIRLQERKPDALSLTAHLITRFTLHARAACRIWEALTYGFSVLGRRYQLLAYSSNQLRSASAWFMAEFKTQVRAALVQHCWSLLRLYTCFTSILG